MKNKNLEGRDGISHCSNLALGREQTSFQTSAKDSWGSLFSHSLQESIPGPWGKSLEKGPEARLFFSCAFHPHLECTLYQCFSALCRCFSGWLGTCCLACLCAGTASGAEDQDESLGGDWRPQEPRPHLLVLLRRHPPGEEDSDARGPASPADVPHPLPATARLPLHAAPTTAPWGTAAASRKSGQHCFVFS